MAPFRDIFSAIDSDRDGVLDEAQFRELVSAVDTGKTSREADDMLARIDPDGNQRITFSECVTGMAQELLKLNNGNSDAGAPAQPPLPPGPPPPGPPPQQAPPQQQLLPQQQ